MDEFDAGGGGGGGRMGKKEKGEVEYKEKSGTAWSHSYLNQKPWHPLSYPNQRRKWIAEQTHANHERRAEEVAREFAQEQESFRQMAMFSQKEKEKMETMKAVSFMYVRPPGYNAESAKAAEIADEKKLDDNNASQEATTTAAVTDMTSEQNHTGKDKKSRPKDVFGRSLPTDEQFEVLKNAPRMETGMPGRVKPFAIEIRNVKCVRCGTFGHQSGDRECPLKDAIMPNEENRLKRDDPLTAIMAQTDSAEPLKWELKQKPGLSPPRGGYQPDDPNQQIVAEEIFDEYGGFLGDCDIPALLSNFNVTKSSKHSKHKSKHKHKSPAKTYDSEEDRRKRKKTSRAKHKKKEEHAESSEDDVDRESTRRTKRRYVESNKYEKSRLEHRKEVSSSSDSEVDKARKRKTKAHHSESNKSRSWQHEDVLSFPDSDMDMERKRRAKGHCSESNKPRSRRHEHMSLSPDSEMNKERKSRGHHRESNKLRSRHREDISSSSDSEDDGARKRRAKGHHSESNKSRSRRHDGSYGSEIGKLLPSDSEEDRAWKRRAKGHHSESNKSRSRRHGSYDSEINKEKKEKSRHAKKKTHRSDSTESESSDSGGRYQWRRRHT